MSLCWGNAHCDTLKRGWGYCAHVTYLSLIVCGYSTHVVVNSGQDRNGLFSDVDSSKDHSCLGNTRQPCGQLLGRQMVKLQVHMILLWSNTPEAIKKGIEKLKAAAYSCCFQGVGLETTVTFAGKVATHKFLSYLPSLISMVMERDTTSLEARSLALGA